MKQHNKKIKVAVGMSGGVDSSVSAKILKDQGYDVVGVFLKLWFDPKCDIKRENACCDEKALQDARVVAQILDIPFYVVDAREPFKKAVSDYFIEEYKNLRTPNPCVVCNEKIKFGWMLDFIEKSGCDKIATGHYARIEKIGKKYHLFKGKDINKDQSYFLYRLSQEQLSKIIFPVGNMTKPEVREFAKKWNLPVHEKAESQEICFIDTDYREFLKRNLPSEYFKSGNIVNDEGNVIGRHEGLINYTIGQRKGIEQTISKIKNQKSKIQIKDAKIPLYVIGFDLEKNELIVGEDNKEYCSKPRSSGSRTREDFSQRSKHKEFQLYRDQAEIEDIKIIAADSLPEKAEVKIRYKTEQVEARIQKLEAGISNQKRTTNILTNEQPIELRTEKVRTENLEFRTEDDLSSNKSNLRARIIFDDPQRAVTPGQSAVIYDGEEVLGGGIICK